MEADESTAAGDRVSTGIDGLDEVLGGGLPRSYTYLIQGPPGTGKTTLALRFCMAGAARNERVLYVTTVEPKSDLHMIARSHGWSLDGITISEHNSQEQDAEAIEQSVFHPAEVELPRLIENLLAIIDQIKPQRLVVDSLSEIRLLDADRRWFRRQVIGLQRALSHYDCTTLLCDDRLTDKQPVESSVRGVINLELTTPEYGPDHGRLRVAKLRGSPYASGHHDYRILTGSFDVYPRLVGSDDRHERDSETISTGVAELDSLYGGGGLDRGSSVLLLGPAGCGKSIVSSQIVMAAADRGEHAAVYLFDENIHTFLKRSRSLGMNLRRHVESGSIDVRQVDPAEMTPGEFSHIVRESVMQNGVRLVVIDSLAGYIHAMPNERLLALHIHELLNYLCNREVTVLLTMAQHGLPGTPPNSPVDLSYISDSVMLLNHFECKGEIRKAISVYKRRGGDHERHIRELQFTSGGIRIGEPLTQFRGILTGNPDFTGTALPDVTRHDQEETLTGS
ncbi:MAG: AAA family ATPase [candidate division Zixibacteria bacterium]|nr:AAA family ATPase [candidate division Zixibacteria bacterium]